MPSSLHTKRFYEAVLTKHNLSTKQKNFRIDYLRHYWLRRICETLFLVVLINGTQQHLLIDGFFGPISPVTGIALSALFMRGRTMLPGIFIGSVIGYYLNQTPFIWAMVYGSFFTLFIFIIREACLRWVGPIAPMVKIDVLLKFILICAFFSALHALALRYFVALPINYYQMWLGELNGILYLTPLCLMLDPFSKERYFTKTAWRWWAGALVVWALQACLLLVPQAHLFKSSLIMLTVLCLNAYSFPAFAVGITLLGLSVLYLGTSFTQYAYESNSILSVLMLQAILSLSISILRKRG